MHDKRGTIVKRRVAGGIARGERAVKEGRIFTHDQAKKRLARWTCEALLDGASTNTSMPGGLALQVDG